MQLIGGTSDMIEMSQAEEDSKKGNTTCRFSVWRPGLGQLSEQAPVYPAKGDDAFKK